MNHIHSDFFSQRCLFSSVYWTLNDDAAYDSKFHCSTWYFYHFRNWLMKKWKQESTTSKLPLNSGPTCRNFWSIRIDQIYPWNRFPKCISSLKTSWKNGEPSLSKIKKFLELVTRNLAIRDILLLIIFKSLYLFCFRNILFGHVIVKMKLIFSKTP